VFCKFIFTDAFDYLKWAMRIANQIGKQRVRILLYEDLVHRPEKFFAQLANIIGDESLLELISLTNKRVIVSPTSGMMLPQLSKSTQWVSAVGKPLHNWIKRMAVREIHLDKRFKSGLLEMYAYSNSLLADEFSLELKEYGYY
jgi:hypothetical protein